MGDSLLTDSQTKGINKHCAKPPTYVLYRCVIVSAGCPKWLIDPTLFDLGSQLRKLNAYISSV
jgi:hypothetical protein